MRSPGRDDSGEDDSYFESLDDDEAGHTHSGTSRRCLRGNPLARMIGNETCVRVGALAGPTPQWKGEESGDAACCLHQLETLC